ncbi:hypothetical protein NOCA2130016 [metagenome]|uniref:Uncharacterized protein n=1 Tax=metagenome TaxID=256318 RepID=A0A2P2BWQ9_9ZZZZ
MMATESPESFFSQTTLTRMSRGSSFELSTFPVAFTSPLSVGHACVVTSVRMPSKSSPMLGSTWVEDDSPSLADWLSPPAVAFDGAAFGSPGGLSAVSLHAVSPEAIPRIADMATSPRMIGVFMSRVPFSWCAGWLPGGRSMGSPVACIPTAPLHGQQQSTGQEKAEAHERHDRHRG